MNKTTSSRVLELTIISGESLTLAGNRPIKHNAYVIITTDSSNNQIATASATDNGSYPFWNQKFVIDMPMNLTYFTLQVRSGDHVVGSARVPVADFTRWCFPTDYLHFLSYRLRDGCGERNGIINVSVKVKSPDNFVGAGGCTSNLSPATGWKCGRGSVGQDGSQGVVIGVP